MYGRFVSYCDLSLTRCIRISVILDLCNCSIFYIKVCIILQESYYTPYREVEVHGKMVKVSPSGHLEERLKTLRKIESRVNCSHPRAKKRTLTDQFDATGNNCIICYMILKYCSTCLLQIYSKENGGLNTCSNSNQSFSLVYFSTHFEQTAACNLMVSYSVFWHGSLARKPMLLLLYDY